MADNKFLFKGIQQVMSLPSNPEKGVIYLVGDGAKGGKGTGIYFGTRWYGKTLDDAAVKELIARLGTAETDIATIKGQIGEWLTNMGTIATVVADHESRLGTAEGKITTIETSLSEVREFAEGVSDSVDSVVSDIIGNISGETTVANEIARVEGLADAAQDGVNAIAADYLKSADKDALEGKITAAQNAADAAQDGVDAIVADYLKSTDKTELEGKITAAQNAAEKVATDFNTAMDSRMDDVEDKVAAIETSLASGEIHSAIADAQDAADKAQGEVDALEIVVGTKAAQSDLTAHTGNGDIHVTAQQKTDWQNATNAINAFLDESATPDNVINTLVEIREYLDGEDGVVPTLLDDVASIKASLSEGGATANAIAAAQSAADAAQGEVDALEKVVGTGFSEDKTVAGEIARVEGIAAAARTEGEVNAQIDAKINSLSDSKDSGEGNVKVTVETQKGNVSSVSVELSEDLEYAITEAHVHSNWDAISEFQDGDKAKLDAAVQSVSVAEGCAMLGATKEGTTVTLALYYGGDDAE